MWADSRRLLNEESWLLYRINPCEICDVKCVNRTGFYIWVLRFSPDQYHATIAPDPLTDQCATGAMQSQHTSRLKADSFLYLTLWRRNFTFKF